VEIGENEEADEVEPADQEADADADSAAPKPARASKPRIPTRYNSKSELVADVKPGENTFDFALEK
jgi:hypothetical protein